MRHVRLERREDANFDSGENFAWAVSYSDLLMVLMSFFILFYSAEDATKRASILSDIALSMKDGSDRPSTKVESTAGHKEYLKETQLSQGDDDLATTLHAILNSNSQNMKTEKFGEVLTIYLPENIFGLRKYDVNPEVIRHLTLVLSSIEKYKSRINIYFVGHTDSKVIVGGEGLIKDNFALSSLRGASALLYALKQGFDSRHLYSIGSADNAYSSRSLSLKIEVIPDRKDP